MKTWGLRAAGWMAMFMGLNLMTRILYTLGRCAETGRGDLVYPRAARAPALCFSCHRGPFRPVQCSSGRRRHGAHVCVPLHSVGMNGPKKADSRDRCFRGWGWGSLTPGRLV